MEADKFNGQLSEMRDSPWLASEDLEDPNGKGYIERVVTIEAVMEIRNAQFKDGRKKDKCFAVKFVEYDRMMVLNATNRIMIKSLHGRTAPEQVGKTVVLYVKSGIKVGAEIKTGLRVKKHDAPPPTEPASLLSAADEKYRKKALADIEVADTLELLNAYGQALKEQSPGVRAALTEPYKARLAKLKAEADTLPPGD